jgi:hypothetical protein
MSEEEGKGFKVTDRRRFTSDGDMKDNAREDTPRPKPAPEPSRASEPASGAGRGERPPMDFRTFVASLAANALGALGMLPKEQAQGLPVNPEVGREYIEILGMLHEKTRGNLSPEEENDLQRVLTDLRKAFVEVSKRAGKR